MIKTLTFLFVIVLAGTSIAQEIEYSKVELMGKFNPSTHADFVLIESTHTSKSGIYLRKEAYDAFKKMYEAAKKEGINLNILSATRNFDYQKGIWEKKWNAPKYKSWKPKDIALDILKYSSMPGTSRHHWGTDVDFNSVESAYFESGYGKKVYDWLAKNAASFGFYQTYTSKEDGRSGYSEEKWHWSYMPLAEKFLNQYNTKISYSDFSGFKGSETAEEIEVIRLYVNGIKKN